MAVDIERLLLKIEASTASASKDLTKIEAQLDSVSRDRTAKVKVETDRNSFRTTISDVEGLFGSVTKMNQGFTGLRNVIGLFKFPVAIQGISLLAQSITALSAGAIGLTSALAPSVGLLATIPQATTAAVQGVAPLLIAFSGLTEAMDAQTAAQTDFSDQTQNELTAAFAKLTPAAQKFVKQFNELNSSFDRMRRTSQEQIFSGINSAVSDLKNTFGPALEEALAGGAGAVGNIIKSFGKELSSNAFVTDFRKVMSSNVLIIDQFGKSLLAVTKGFTNLAVTAIPLTQGISRLLLQGAQAFERWSAEGRKTGELATFFERTLTVTQQLSDILGNLYTSLKNVGKAATPLGDTLLASIEKGTKALADLTSKSETITKMRDYFNATLPALQQFGLLLKDIAGVFIDVGAQSNLASILKQVRAELVPILAQFNSTTIQAFATQLVKAFASIASVFLQLSQQTGGLTQFATAIGILGGALSKLLSIPGIAPFVATMLTLKTVFSALNILGVAKVFTGVASALSSMVGPVGQATTGLAGLVNYFRISQGGISGFRDALNASITTTQAFGTAAVAVIGLLVTLKQSWDANNEAARSFKSSVGEAVDSSAKQGFEQFKDQMAAVDEEANRVKDSLNTGWNFGQNIIDSVNGFQSAQEKNLNVLNQTKEAMQAQSDTAEYLAAATGKSKDETLAYVVAQNNAGIVVGQTEEATRKFLNWWKQDNTAKEQAEQVKIYQDALQSVQTAQATAASAASAYQAATDRVKQAQEAVVQAERSRIQSLRSLQKAQESVAEAQEALNKALQGASALDLAEGDLAVRQAYLNQEKAAIALADAQGTLNKGLEETKNLIKDITLVQDEFTGKTYEVVRIEKEASKNSGDANKTKQQQAIELKQAQLDLEQANIAVLRAEESMNQLRQKGSETDEAVIQARKQLRDANYALEDAQYAYNESLRAEGRAHSELAKAYADAAQAKIIATFAFATAMTAAEDAAKKLNTTVAQLFLFMGKLDSIDPELFAKVVEKVGFDQAVNLFTNPALTKREFGGRVTKGEAYIVGEKRPEVFVPDTSGYVYPDAARYPTSQQIDQSKKTEINQTFNEKADPQLIAADIAWSTR